MNNFTYQEEVKRTLNKKLTEKEQMLNMALGLCGEAGEVADMIKKHMYQGHDLDKEELIKELGDISWYLFNMMNVLDVYSSKVFSININKLKKRYEKGFSEQASVKRVDNEIEECSRIIKEAERYSEEEYYKDILKALENAFKLGRTSVRVSEKQYNVILKYGQMLVKSGESLYYKGILIINRDKGND